MVNLPMIAAGNQMFQAVLVMPNQLQMPQEQAPNQLQQGQQLQQSPQWELQSQMPQEQASNQFQQGQQLHQSQQSDLHKQMPQEQPCQPPQMQQRSQFASQESSRRHDGVMMPCQSNQDNIAQAPLGQDNWPQTSYRQYSNGSSNETSKAWPNSSYAAHGRQPDGNACIVVPYPANGAQWMMNVPGNSPMVQMSQCATECSGSAPGTDDSCISDMNSHVNAGALAPDTTMVTHGTPNTESSWMTDRRRQKSLQSAVMSNGRKSKHHAAGGRNSLSKNDYDILTALQLPHEPTAIKESEDLCIRAKMYLTGDNDQWRDVVIRWLMPVVKDFAVSKAATSRVVQKVFEMAGNKHYASLVEKFQGHAVDLTLSKHGNHTLQALIQYVPPEMVTFVLVELSMYPGGWAQLACNNFACRVMQRLLEHCELAKHSLADDIVQDGNLEFLCCADFGNYVVQHAIVYGTDVQKEAVAEFLLDDVRERGMCVYDIEAELEAQVELLMKSHNKGSKPIQTIGSLKSTCVTLISSLAKLGNVAAVNKWVIKLKHHNMIIEHPRCSVSRKQKIKLQKLAEHRIASNVVEKAMLYCSSSQNQERLACELIWRGTLVELAKDKFGSFVVRRLLEVTSGSLRRAALEQLLKEPNWKGEYQRDIPKILREALSSKEYRMFQTPIHGKGGS
jgi:hypothetical protein